jgi:hypothetical protein
MPNKFTFFKHNTLFLLYLFINHKKTTKNEKKTTIIGFFIVSV